jgi:hypothetical protein
VPALGPVGTVSIPIPIPVLNLASPLSKGFRIVAGVTGLSVVIVNPNAFPAAYDVEIRMATFVLKAARFTLAPGKSKTVRLKFSRAAKRFIARKRPRRARVTVKVTGRVASGASKAFTTVRTVTLKRPKRKKH